MLFLPRPPSVVASSIFFHRNADQARSAANRAVASYRQLLPRTKLILEYAKGGRGREALRIYKGMREQGVAPNPYNMVAALKACIGESDLAAGKGIHADVIESGHQSDLFVTTTLVDMYVKCGSMADARQVFEAMPHRDVVSWNAIIMGYAREEEMGELALQLYARMQHEGFAPNDRTFVAALKACGNLAVQEQGKQVDGQLVKIESLEKGRAIHSQLARRGFETDVFVANTLVGMYVKCGSIVDAWHVCEKMKYRNLVSWNAMILGYAQMEKGDLALQLYARLQHEGLTADAYTFVASLKACASLAVQEEAERVHGELLKIRCLENGRTIHFQIAKKGFEADIFVANALVDMYAKCGSMVEARQVFERMSHHDVVSWTAIILGYAQKEEGKLALHLFTRMQHEGSIPDAYTFGAALMACGSLACLEAGRRIHAEICRVGLERDAFVVNCLVDMYGKCGSMVDAQWLFDVSPVRDVVRWSALIAGYSGQGDSDPNLLEKMQQEGIQPVSSTFVSVLAVCSHSGLVDNGQNYFQVMCSDYEVSPSSEHYNCMVDLLGRAGQLDQAMAIVKKLPFSPNIVTWMTILSACQKWNNVEVGSRAFDCEAKLDRKHDAAYILMMNVYASACMWEEIAKIQAMRANAKSWKKPRWYLNCAGINGRGHTKAKDVYAKLTEIPLLTSRRVCA